jgi:asparagine synthase (glutamine-hydrolysing)
MLDQAVGRMRWRRGKAVRDHCAGLEIAALVDGADGPHVETRGGQTILVHGAVPGSLAEVQRREPRFAAVAWDGRVLRASRDPMGLAPLFYRVVDRSMWLATEAQPLLALGKAAPDLEALTASAAFVPLDGRTGWESIFRVLPGSTIEMGQDLRVSSTPYWRPSDHLGRYRGDRAEALAEFRERFGTAVGRCYEPGSGILLSGGLDSSAVAVVAGQAGGARPHLVHVAFDGFPETDEREYAAAVAAAVGVPLHVVSGEVSPWDARAELDRWGGIAYTWIPNGIPDPALTHLASRGIRVALDGHDGDGALGVLGSNWGDLVLHGQLRRIGALTARHGAWPLVRGLAVDFLPTPWLRRLAGRPARATYMESVARYVSGALGPRIAAEADIERWAWPSRRWRARQLQPLLPRATFTYEMKEIEAARHGIDMRHPFADRDLVQFLVSLPSAIKSDPMRPKTMLVDSLGDLLPGAVTGRPKGDHLVDVRRRVDTAACIEVIRASGVHLPGVEYDRLFEDARSDPDRMPLYFLIALARAHTFAR